MNSNNINYIKAYTEFNCLLKYLPKSYIDKLPNKLIKLIQNQFNEQYYIYIDPNKSLLEQNFSKKTKDLIAVIKYNYWSTDEEKQQLMQIFYENENKYQKQSLEKYSPDNIFERKNKQTEIPQEKIKNTNQMIVYKKNIFNIFFSKLKNIFRKN